MELVYLWVDNYKNIEKQGFNFSGQYRCEYNPDINELTIDKNKKYVHIFPNNINVTAIIGKNGVGKSAILEILNSGNDGIFLIFYKQDSDEFLFHQIKISGFQTQNIKSSEILNKPIKVGWYNENLTSFPLSTVFYTNIVNNRTDEMYYGDEVATHKKNISTGYLIHKTNKHLMEMSPKENCPFPFVSFYNQFKIAQSEDVKFAIDYLKNTNHSLPFTTPKNLIIEINSRLLKDSRFMNKYTHEGIKDFELGQNSINYLKRAIIYNFLDYQILNNGNLPNQNEFIKLADEECLYDEKIQDIDNLYKAFDAKFNKIFPFKYDFGHTELLFFKEYFNTANEFLKICEQIFDREHGRLVYCSIEKMRNDFIELYQKLITAGLPFLTFTFSPHLSSGEENFLYMFARFYGASKTRMSNDQLEDNILFCIDEGELTLHPDWQKQYIKYWVDFLSDNFQEYNIHLVLTSHSPFILSDIPKENVIFLENGEQKYPFKNSEQTFGANIHTLLSHGFFMADGLMGEFAKSKINDVYDFLSNPNTQTNLTQTKAQEIINLIGEPLIKRQLEDIYNKKFKIKSKDEIIQELQNKIAELEKNQNDSN
jgi:hypothetical protein